ncbi:MAG: hypothetical protein U0736_20720 [Gemmataceae bacterium]
MPPDETAPAAVGGDLSVLPAGDPAAIGRAVVALDHQFRHPVCGWLARTFPGLSAEDREDVWAEVLTDVLRAARLRRIRADPSAYPWLRRIAAARAVDLVRRKRVQREALLTLQGRFDPAAGRPRAVPAAVLGAELLTLLTALLLRLPRRQRLVLEVYVAHFPNSARLAVLRQQVAQATGVDESPAAVRRALQEGKRKLAAWLARHGYTPDGTA